MFLAIIDSNKVGVAADGSYYMIPSAEILRPVYIDDDTDSLSIVTDTGKELKFAAVVEQAPDDVVEKDEPNQPAQEEKE
jgi:hypothetical protein